MPLLYDASTADYPRAMRVALFTTFKATRKEPLAEMFQRVHRGFLSAGLHDLQIKFTFADAPVAGFTSSIARVTKRFPSLEPLVIDRILPGGASMRAIEGIAEPGDVEQLIQIAAGVPRSFPFHNAQFWFTHPVFGEPVQLNPITPVTPE